MPKRNIKCTFAYDGKRYSGWQRLGGDAKETSIQGRIEMELGLLLGEEIRLIGSGRTDQGVHALGAVANFHTRSAKELELLKQELNQRLPEDIRCLSMEEVEESFHSRYSAREKTYVYIIDDGEVESVFTRDYQFHHSGKLDLDRMREGAAFLIGEHDFAAFSSAMRDDRSSVREIRSITIDRVDKTAYSVHRKNSRIEIAITGNGFLYNMVRIIVGTLIEVGEGRRDPLDLRKALEGKDRALAGPMAQYQGLFLKGVQY